MDKIFKNNTIMGIVAVATLVVTLIMFARQNKDCGYKCYTPQSKEE